MSLKDICACHVHEFEDKMLIKADIIKMPTWSENHAINYAFISLRKMPQLIY